MGDLHSVILFSFRNEAELAFLTFARYRSSHPDIEELDVFELESEINGAAKEAPQKNSTTRTREEEEQQQRLPPPYDVIVASMVINCLPDALSRGRFLVLLKKLVKPQGLIFLTLPGELV